MDKFSKDGILARVGKMEQLAHIRRSVLDDGKGRGMRVFDVLNCGGISFSVCPDKGLDIANASFKGIPLAWISPNGAVGPAFYEKDGMGWLRSWSGGLLTTCGPMNVGGPCECGGLSHGLHGRFDHTPAENVNASCKWDGRGDYVMEITGEISSTSVFGEKLITSRTIRARFGVPEIEISDTTENASSSEMPFMLLYHVNLGYPFIDENSRIEAIEHAVAPQKDYPEEISSRWNVFRAPHRGIEEEVYYHDVPPSPNGFSSISVTSPSTGVRITVSSRKKELPYFIEWKMTGEKEYVLGIEPSNCYPEGQNSIRERGMLKMLQPGERIESRIVISAQEM